MPYSKSLEEYRERRGVPLLGERADFRRNDELLRLIESDTVEDIAIQRFVPALQSRLGRGRGATDGNVVPMTAPRITGRKE